MGLPLLVLLTLGFILCLWSLYRWLTRHHHLPPGPPGDPFIGHIRVFPRSNHHEVFTKWSQQYGRPCSRHHVEDLTLNTSLGDVMHFNILGKSIIVLSSQRAAQDLLDKRSANYSSRPDFPVHEL